MDSLNRISLASSTIWVVEIASEILVGHEPYDVIVAPVLKVEIILLSDCGINDTIRFLKLVAFGDGGGDF